MWLGGSDMAGVVPWLVAFLVLTIVGERLELSRMRRPPARRAAAAARGGRRLPGRHRAGGRLAGVGVRLAGAGLLAQAAWLARYDVARRTIRMPGAHALHGHRADGRATSGWPSAGVVWLASGALIGGGFGYDAMVHAIFLGFVFSMVFAHAPVIVPAVLGVPLPYRRRSTAPLALLHVGLVVRLAGDAAGNVTAWRWGGALNELAILGFVAVAARTVVAGAPGRRRPRNLRPSSCHAVRGDRKGVDTMIVATTSPVLVFLALLGASVWMGGFVTIVVVTRVARAELEGPDPGRLLPRAGPGFGAVSTAALIMALACGAVLVADHPWDGTVVAAIVVAVALVLATVAGVLQARAMTRLRRRAVAAPGDEALAERVRRGAIAAAVLRAVLGGLSIGLLALAAELAT